MEKLVILFILLLTFFLATCQNRQEKTVAPSSNTTELSTLRLGIIPTMESLPFLIAQKEGFFDSLGLNLTISRFNSARDQNAAFQSGRIDGMITDFPNAAVLFSQHNNLSFVMKNEGYFCFIVSRESHIARIQQLKLKNIAVSNNTIIEYATDRLLSKNGLLPTEVNKPSIGQIPLRLTMLQYGQIDASFLPDPYASIAMSYGHKSLISTQELNIDVTGTAFSHKASISKAKEIGKLIEGYNLGVEYIRSHPQKEWSLVLVEMGVPENLTGLIALPPYKKATLPSPKEIDKVIDWLKANDRISHSFSGKDLIDTTFINNTTDL